MACLLAHGDATGMPDAQAWIDATICDRDPRWPVRTVCNFYKEKEEGAMRKRVTSPAPRGHAESPEPEWLDLEQLERSLAAARAALGGGAAEKVFSAGRALRLDQAMLEAASAA